LMGNGDGYSISDSLRGSAVVEEVEDAVMVQPSLAR
jgi:hypothetical protein